MLGMFIAFLLLSVFLCLLSRAIITDGLYSLLTGVGLAVITVGAAYLLSGDDLRAEMIPLLVFGMTIANAFHAEIALLLALNWIGHLFRARPRTRRLCYFVECGGNFGVVDWSLTNTLEADSDRARNRYRGRCNFAGCECP